MSAPPTGLGAVIRATVSDQWHGTVLVRTGRPEGRLGQWIPTDYGGAVTDSMLSDIEVLHPDIEAPQ